MSRLRESLTTTRSFFYSICFLSLFLSTLLTSSTGHCQPSDRVDPTHNYNDQSESDRQEPKDDVGDSRSDQEEKQREETSPKPPKRDVPPTDRPDEQVRKEERFERQERKQRAEEKRQRRYKENRRLEEERERKAVEKQERTHRLKENNLRRVEQQRQEQLLKPDLIAANLEVLPAATHQYQTIKLVASIHNKSEQKTKDIPVHFYLGTTPIGEKVIHLKSEETREVDIDVSMAFPGTHEVTVKVDPNNRISEKTKRNNQLKRTVEVIPAPIDDKPVDSSQRISKTNKQLPIQPTTPSTGQKQKVDSTPRILGKVKKQTAVVIPDQRIFYNQPGFANLQIFVPTNNGLVIGGGKYIDVKVVNGGDTNITTPFTIGFCKAKDAKSNNKGKYLGTKVVGSMKKNSAIATTIPWQKGTPEEKVNYTAIVDTANAINEGSKGGENDNISNIFKYTTLTVIPPKPTTVVSVKNLKITPAWITELDWITINADVSGEDYWELSYSYLDYQGNVKTASSVLSSWSTFPDTGIKVPSPFLKGMKSSTSQPEIAPKISIRLTAKNSKSGQSDKDEFILNRGHPLNGTMTMSQCFYGWDKTTKTVTNITAKLHAKTNTTFKIDGYGSRPALGSLSFFAMVINKEYGVSIGSLKTSSKLNTSPLKDKIVKGTSITLKKVERKSPACENYLSYKDVIGSLKQSTFKPKNGLIEIPIKIDLTCNKKVEGYQYPYGPGIYTGRPEASLVVRYSTTSGDQALNCTMPVWEAPLKMTTE